MKEMYARRLSGNLYEVTYSDDRAEDKGQTWADVVKGARQGNYSRVRINNAYRGEGEPATFTVAADDLDPFGWAHLLPE